MKILAVSDLHSFLHETKRAVDECGMLEDDGAVLLVIGDVLDRGPDPIGMTEYLLDLASRGKLIFVRGNHEDLLEEALAAIEDHKVVEVLSASNHTINGTAETILKLAGMTESEALGFPRDLVRRVRESRFYTELLPLAVDYYETDGYIFTHGWIPCFIEGFGSERKYSYDPEWRLADRKRWRVARTLNGMELAKIHGITEEGKTVVCGHFHTSYGHANFSKICTERGDDAIFEPYYSDGIIAIDACTVKSKRVNLVLINEEK
jgi:hypothetical protein